MAGTLTVQTLQGPTTDSDANTVLMANGHNFHAPGCMVQFEHARHDPGSTAITSTSLVDTGLTLNITPKFSNSYFYIVASMYESYTGNSNSTIQYAINRNGTIVGDHQGATIGFQGASPHYWNTTLTYVDVPNTTGVLTYKIQAKSPYGHSVYYNSDNTQTHLQVMEIAR